MADAMNCVPTKIAEDMSLPQRKSPRLQGYDYAQAGAYFITICTFQRDEIFGVISEDQLQPSEIGLIATACWDKLPTYFPNISLDAFVLMPNHLHGIIVLDNQTDKGNPIPLGRIVRAYKSLVSRSVNQAFSIHAPRLWQGRYHDHIIRNESDLQRLRAYIEYNPARWAEDTFYSAVPPGDS